MGERNGFFTFFRRTAAGTLTNAGRLESNGTDIQTDNNSWPFVVDWNEDGRKDLLVGQEGIGAACNVFVYLNQGTNSAPVFGDSTPVLRSGLPFRDYRCVPLGLDLDHDGNKDLVLGEWYSSVRFYRNQGTNADPLFTTFINFVPPDPDSFLNGNPPRVNFVDWDGDLDLDMLTCDYYGSVFLRRNITPTGAAEEHRPSVAPPGVPTVMRAPGFARLTGRILDTSGRDVSDRRQAISPGIYFIRGERSSVRRVLVVD